MRQKVVLSYRRKEKSVEVNEHHFLEHLFGKYFVVPVGPTPEEIMALYVMGDEDDDVV